MRQVYVQRCTSGEYLTPDEGWSGDASDARDFGNTLTALAYCLQHDVRDVQVVLKFPSDTPDFVIPLEPAAAAASRWN